MDCLPTSYSTVKPPRAPCHIHTPTPAPTRPLSRSRRRRGTTSPIHNTYTEQVVDTNILLSLPPNARVGHRKPSLERRHPFPRRRVLGAQHGYLTLRAAIWPNEHWLDRSAMLKKHSPTGLRRRNQGNRQAALRVHPSLVLNPLPITSVKLASRCDNACSKLLIS